MLSFGVKYHNFSFVSIDGKLISTKPDSKFWSSILTKLQRKCISEPLQRAEVSSANKKFKREFFLNISFIKHRNRKGPRILPYGTPMFKSLKSLKYYIDQFVSEVPFTYYFVYLPIHIIY